MMNLDETHDPSRKSWVASANTGTTDFPIQNLPLGMFSCDGSAPRPGIAIGDFILDLRDVASMALLQPELAALLRGPDLDVLLASGIGAIEQLRKAAADLLDEQGDPSVREKIEGGALVDMSKATMHLPTSVRSFTDFFAGYYHVRESGRLTKADPVMPRNFSSQPLGYNGRASSVRISGEPVRRPRGQRPVDGELQFGPCRWLDFEVELGAFIAGSNDLGDPVPIADAGERVAGFCLLNDWSARDIQLWEMAPLGPINSKGFSTTISPWIVTPHAMVPFRTVLMPRMDGDPAPPAYLSHEHDLAKGGVDFEMEAYLQSEAMRENGDQAVRIVTTNARYLYWTFAQMVTHLSCGGTNLCPGDLLGSGTISGPEREMFGSLVEMTTLGNIPLELPNGETRTFLEDGDEVIFRARCVRDGFASIGFGECAGRILSALPV